MPKVEKFVIDTNVVLKWFLAADEEPYIDKAMDILDRFTVGTLKLYAPRVLYYEAAHALTRWSKQSSKTYITSEKSKSIYEDLINLGIKTSEPSLKAASWAIDASVTCHKTYKDMLFLKRAIDLKCLLITNDENIINSIPKNAPFTSDNVFLLKNW